MTGRAALGRGGRVWGWGPSVWLGAGLALVAAATVALHYSYAQVRIGPAQPLPFSHRLHSGVKEIGCPLCHAGALERAHAGIPALETCLLCHHRIAIHMPPIETLRASYAEGHPIAWVKVNDVPDHVYFVHDAHTRLGFDCGRCHGDTAAMDRIAQIQPFTMGFCADCHRQEQASTDCLICHR